MPRPSSLDLSADERNVIIGSGPVTLYPRRARRAGDKPHHMAEPSLLSGKGTPGGALVPVGTRSRNGDGLATFERKHRMRQGFGGSERALADNQRRTLTPFEPV